MQNCMSKRFLSALDFSRELQSFFSPPFQQVCSEAAQNGDKTGVADSGQLGHLGQLETLRREIPTVMTSTLHLHPQIDRWEYRRTKAKSAINRQSFIFARRLPWLDRLASAFDAVLRANRRFCAARHVFHSHTSSHRPILVPAPSLAGGSEVWRVSFIAFVIDFYAYCHQGFCPSYRTG